MSKDGDTVISDTRSESNLNEEDFYDMLKGVDVCKNDSSKTKNEHRHWSMLLHDSVDEMIENLKRLNMPRKKIQPLTRVRQKSSLNLPRCMAQLT